MQRFDSLLNAHADAQARALCTGAALQTFPFLLETERKIDPFVDSARSRDTVIEEKQAGRWCGLKVASDAFFKKRVMGMDSVHLVQAVYLFRRSDGWKLADFEELTDEKAPLVLRSGIPAGADTGSSAAFFPRSPRAPEDGGITRMLLESFLAQWRFPAGLASGIGSTDIKARKGLGSLETQIPPVPHEGSINQNDSLKAYLGSGSYLDLGDSLLLAKAAELCKGATDEVEIARRVYRFVSSSFHFQLGAALFSDSREALRSMRGDCSEAAVLTAALLRAEGIPSRVALGFATTGRGVFIGHAWVEAFINGQWVGVDAALREFPAGAERVELLRLSGSRDMFVEASNLMFRSLSNLEIEIMGAWAGSKPLPLDEQKGNTAESREYFEQILQGVGG